MDSYRVLKFITFFF